MALELEIAQEPTPAPPAVAPLAVAPSALEPKVRHQRAAKWSKEIKVYV